MLYSINLYIGITISISWASFTCVLIISLEQLVNGAQLLNITFLVVLFTAAPASAVFGAFVVPLTCTYASL